MESRRSANYQASIWDDNFIQSLASPYAGEKYAEKAEKLKTEVKTMIDQTRDELKQLELIDNLQRLGICHHFQDLTKKILQKIYGEERNGDHQHYKEKGLHFTALRFRILRQDGYHVPQDVFSSFMNKAGDFEESLSKDTKGLVSLYEASYLSMEGETILDMAKDFSSHHLHKMVEDATDKRVANQIIHSLEMPLHRRVQKLEAIWFIQFYECGSDANPTLVELAKLDFNMVQATYQEELKRLSRWYEETGLQEKLSFARHRLAEAFLWSMGIIPEGHFGYGRMHLMKIGAYITLLDDIYDVYGTLEELQVLTEIIERWDINLLDQLPEYMQIFFLYMFNSTNELAYEILRDQGINVISNLKGLWVELSQCYFKEATWFHNGYTPTTEEYLNVACISASGPVILFSGYFTTTNPINKHELQSLERHAHSLSMILRLADDLGTSSDEMKRGDVPKAIQCFMNDTGCCEEEARQHVKRLIDAEWKKMNKDILMEKPFKNFCPTAMNLGRISMSFYEHGDGYGGPHSDTKKKMVSLFVQPMNITI
uniref:Alpha-zingiberene synthase n=1 Tax=Ocimum basilicum TaxID=39350 RepID=AZIS_OCIBA|nr:RecName: Full=Alpha-zingiberene synthase [Ocimum basilicum]AAV63788.1 alpha-zingiberene synthase [Ocimum basilicum]